MNDELLLDDVILDIIANTQAENEANSIDALDLIADNTVEVEEDLEEVSELATEVESI